MGTSITFLWSPRLVLSSWGMLTRNVSLMMYSKNVSTLGYTKLTKISQLIQDENLKDELKVAGE